MEKLKINNSSFIVVQGDELLNVNGGFSLETIKLIGKYVLAAFSFIDDYSEDFMAGFREGWNAVNMLKCIRL